MNTLQSYEIPLSCPDNDSIVKSDLESYIQYFNSIRDYIIDNIDQFSTDSLIKAMETYYKEDEIPENRYRIQQGVDVYNYCLQHQNNIKPNKNDCILGALLISGFIYGTHGSDCYKPDDKVAFYDYIEEFLEINKINNTSWSNGCYLEFHINDIEGALKLLIPEFNFPQPPYHYDKHVRQIEVLDILPITRFITSEENQ